MWGAGLQRLSPRRPGRLFLFGIHVTVFVCCLLSFLIGGIPFGFLVGRLVLKDDIRNHGSGNIGATNVARVIGWKWGSLVLLLDAVKGLVPTWLAMIYARDHLSESMHLHLPVAAGLSTIMGHMYPVYLKLRGGKGVATALGVVTVLAPKAVGVALLFFVLLAATTRIVALASIVAATAFGVAELYLLRDTALEPKSLSLTIFTVAVPALIIWRHRSNIARLIRGTEAPMTSSSGTTNAEQTGSSSGDSASVDGG
ncbi:MAG: glycerol-3-phosphate 1-O-acyltransferase PlsY [Fuerstiella sp.]